MAVQCNGRSKEACGVKIYTGENVGVREGRVISEIQILCSALKTPNYPHNKQYFGFNILNNIKW